MAWYDELFDESYGKLYTYLDDERSEKEVDFLIEVLDIKPDHRILDIPCGFGRHACFFAKRGYHVTGIDYNRPQIEKAREMMKQKGAEFEILEGDMRAIPYENHFHRLYNYFTSFGYFSEEENFITLQQFYKALCPGGKMQMEIINRDYIIRNYEKACITRLDSGEIMLEERGFDFETGRQKVKRTFLAPGEEPRVGYIDLRLYSPHELKNLFEAAGFRVLKILGDGEVPVSFNSPRINITAEKP